MRFTNKQYKQAVKRASKMTKSQLERIAVNGKSIKDMTPEERAIVVRKIREKADLAKVEKEIAKEVAEPGSPVAK